MIKGENKAETKVGQDDCSGSSAKKLIIDRTGTDIEIHEYGKKSFKTCVEKKRTFFFHNSGIYWPSRSTAYTIFKTGHLKAELLLSFSADCICYTLFAVRKYGTAKSVTGLSIYIYQSQHARNVFHLPSNYFRTQYRGYAWIFWDAFAFR